MGSNLRYEDSRSVSIAEASQRTGLSRHALRFYERAGRFEPVERSTSGRRQYEASDLDWFAFLVRLRQAEMPITQMQQFARLHERTDAQNCRNAIRRADRHDHSLRATF